MFFSIIFLVDMIHLYTSNILTLRWIISPTHVSTSFASIFIHGKFHLKSFGSGYLATIMKIFFQLQLSSVGQGCICDVCQGRRDGIELAGGS